MMMVYLQLTWSFFKIGLFGFGGGYAMIPLIQREIESHGWVQAREFADIVAISQMTPGPIAVNAATYIGAKVGGIPGSIFATIGVSLPSFILIILIAKFFMKFKNNKIVESVLAGIRPVTIGLIGSAVIFFAEMSIFRSELPFDRLRQIFAGRFGNPINGISINPGALLIFAVILLATKKFKLHPILAIVVSAVLGILLV